jgi:DNA polymerase-3 subunit gamma/tau
MAAKSKKTTATAPSNRTASSSGRPEQYHVVARRYRPQAFADLVGQTHVSTPLLNAIQQHRIGHAYLFSGARGTGKTSTARILAKCLNCQSGPTIEPCQTCDICQGITSGDDIDVLEIDGASNRRIEEIRQLRSTVSVRPSRARFKIYIIDEVHMLTKEAFNALLKTLEEPPDHVKFIFCTTELDKIPITIRSRCQLFEFTPVEESSIRERLKSIAAAEHVELDDDAVTLLARRAAGSLRDSQSLLEQLLSLGQSKIALRDVNQLLGTADSELLSRLSRQLVERRTAEAIGTAHRAFAQGVDAGQLAAQLLGYFRDGLAASVGCGDELLLNVSPDQYAAVRELGKQIGAEQALAIAQILDECLVRMRGSSHPQVQLEIALVWICRLEKLQALSDLIEQLQAQPRGSVAAPTGPRVGPAPPATRPLTDEAESSGKKNERREAEAAPRESALASPSSGPADLPTPLTAENVATVWKAVLRKMGDATAEMAGNYRGLAWKADGRIVVTQAESVSRFCNRPETKTRIEAVLREVTGQNARVEFVVAAGEPSPGLPPAPASKLKQIRESSRDPLVQAALELFDAEITNVSRPGPGAN